MEKGNGKKTRRRHLLVNVGISVMLMFGVVVLLNFFDTALSYSRMYLASATSASDKVTAFLNDRMQSYEALPWLLDYWTENWLQLDLAPEYEGDADGKWREAHKLFYELNEQYITPEELSTLSDDLQKKFAEFCHVSIVQEFDSVASTYRTNGIFCAVMLGDNQIFLPFRGNDDASDETTYYEGSIITLREEHYSKVQELLEEAGQAKEVEDLKTMEVASGRNAGDVLFYRPVYRENRLCCLICVSVSAGLVENQMYEEASRVTRRTWLYLGVTCALILILLLLVVMRPIGRLQKSVQEYEQNKSSEEADKNLMKICRSDNEIGYLARSFTGMTHEIDRYTDEVRAVTVEKERIGTELEMAKVIQRSQLPSKFPPYPDRKEFDIFASMTPAREVGGDFYDFFMVDDEHLALVMADVSGKGVPAALMMMVAKILIKNRITGGDCPAAALANVNSQICEGNGEDMFVTVWLAVIDLATGRGIAANAGHEHPALCRPGGDYELVVYRHSLPVGAMLESRFREHEFEIEPGGSLFVYTDGVTEAANRKNVLFGTDRMLRALNRQKNVDPRRVISSMMAEIRDFAGGAKQFDDITMLCFRYNGLEKNDE